MADERASPAERALHAFLADASRTGGQYVPRTVTLGMMVPPDLDLQQLMAGLVIRAEELGALAAWSEGSDA